MFDEHEGAIVSNAVTGASPGVMQGDIARSPGLGDPTLPYVCPTRGGGVVPPPPVRPAGGCVDDPTGAVAGGGQSCPALVPMLSDNCDFDLSALVSAIPVGTTLRTACPLSCNACGAAPVPGQSFTNLPGMTAAVVTQSTSKAGYVTKRLSLTLSGTSAGSPASIYAVFGDTDPALSPLDLPPAFQVAAPFGADIGGVNPTFYAFSPDAEYDSWITCGVEGGNPGGELTSVGITWASWTETTGIMADNGAVFWMNPDHASSGGTVLVAQLTVPANAPAITVRMGLQGKSVSAQEWQTAASFSL